MFETRTRWFTLLYHKNTKPFTQHNALHLCQQKSVIQTVVTFKVFIPICLWQRPIVHAQFLVTAEYTENQVNHMTNKKVALELTPVKCFAKQSVILCFK